jgi:hypothetical protein
MEATMTNRTIKHEIKLQKSVVVILGLLAIGVCANAFAPAFSIKDAMAQLHSGATIYIEHRGRINSSS